MSDFIVRTSEYDEIILEDTFLKQKMVFTSDEIDEVIELLTQASEKVN